MYIGDEYAGQKIPDVFPRFFFPLDQNWNLRKNSDQPITGLIDL